MVFINFYIFQLLIIIYLYHLFLGTYYCYTSVFQYFVHCCLITIVNVLHYINLVMYHFMVEWYLLATFTSPRF